MRQNRVDPFGQIVATAERGTLMGNRGVLHDDQDRLGVARWRHQAWIACRLSFRGRRRSIMAPGRWTELFFLDEATALAAGHRPCAECRRADFLAFQHAWRATIGGQARAPDMDRRLHRDRVGRDRRQVTFRTPLGRLPDGAMVAVGAQAMLYWEGRLWPWSFAGYGPPVVMEASREVQVLTPRVTVAVLAGGYRCSVHKSLE